MKSGIKVKFWGVRGSIPTPGVKYVKYGGNTSCVEILLPNDMLFIFDAGTGIRELGNSLLKNGKKQKVYIFLSHFHWDHIQGLPFFVPSYQEGNEINILGMNTKDARLDKIISNQMESVYFPVRLQSLKAKIKFQVLTEGKLCIDDATINTIYTNHPGMSMGYVITIGKTKIGYFTDNEIVPIPLWSEDTSSLKYQLDMTTKMIALLRDADLLIHDAQYTTDEYKHKVGWGHSSIPEVVSLAMEARVKRLALFHHDPDRFDDHIDVLVANCKEVLNDLPLECFAAHEGMEMHF